MMHAAFVVAALLAPGQAPEPPPLTPEQRSRLSQLAQGAKEETARLKGLLEERQQVLARVYAEYDLDEKQATKLEKDILDLQQQMLASYRIVQIGLRATVERERFMHLKKRLDYMLHSAAQKPANNQTPPARP